MSDDKYVVDTHGSLSIRDTVEEDEGTYKVELSNSAGTVSEEIQVDLIQRIRK